MTPTDPVEEAHRVIEKHEHSLRKEAKKAFRDAEKAGFTVVSVGEWEAANYYGLISRGRDKNCEIVQDPDSNDTWAVVPYPGFEAICTPERDRRRGNKENRKLRHEVFQRIRKFKSHS